MPRTSTNEIPRPARAPRPGWAATRAERAAPLALLLLAVSCATHPAAAADGRSVTPPEAAPVAGLPAAPSAGRSAAAPYPTAEIPAALPAMAGLARLGTLGEPLGWEDFLEGALLASGGTEGERDAARSLIVAALGEWTAEAALLRDGTERASAALDFLHERFFRRYVEEQTRVDLAALGGDYNCVSSAALYAVFAKAAGIDAAAVVTPDHAFCLVRVGGRSVDVETTNPYGFDPGSRKDFTDSFGRVTGYAYVPPTAYSRRRVTGDREFLGLILSNRATLLEREGAWREAVALGSDYLDLVGGATGRTFYLDRVSNLVSWLDRRGDSSGALASIAEAEDRAGSDGRLDELELAVTLNALARLGEAGRWDEGWNQALALKASGFEDGRLELFLKTATNNSLAALLAAGRIEEAAALLEGRAPSLARADASAFRAMVAEARLAKAVRAPDFGTALAGVEAVAAAGVLGEARTREAFAYVYVREANRVGGTSGWLAAWKSLAPALARWPSDRTLLEAGRAFRANAVAEYHNRFVSHWNAGRRAEARATIEEALRELPGEKALLEDLAVIERSGY
ncbi:MAG TPA: hypothetical protein PKW82_02760 [Spirochaetales bacterium]|nr:hypothetical protein [Spirochaetales bacterium]